MSKRNLFLGILSVFTLSLQLFATTVLYKSFDDLVRESDGIVTARVAEIDSQYSPNKEIFTFVTFDEVEILGGIYHGSRLTLRFNGGQVDNNISQVVGSPNFEVNDRVVLFIQGNGHYMVPLVGWTQGVFRIVQDAATGQQVIHDHEGNPVLGIQAGRVIKDEAIQPEAQIVGRERATAQSPGNAGSADDGSVSAASEGAPAAGPAISSQAFLDVIRKAASHRINVSELHSLAVGDFSVPSGNQDAGTGPKVAAGQSPQSQAPVLPNKRPLPQAKDQQ